MDDKLHSFFGADFTDNGASGIDPKRGHGIAGFVFGINPSCLEIVQSRAHVQGGLHGMLLLRFTAAQGSERSHEPVTHESVQGSKVFEDCLGHLFRRIR